MTTCISTKPARRLLSIMALCAGLVGALGCKPEGRGGEPPAAEQAEPVAPAEPAPTEAAKPAEPPPQPAQPAEPPATAEPPVPAAPADPSAPPPEPAAPEPAEPVKPAQPDKPGKSAAAPTTADECTAAGGSVVPSIGSKPTCPEGKKSIGNIKLGIEGGICCK
jgi:hypothetical protein